MENNNNEKKSPLSILKKLKSDKPKNGHYISRQELKQIAKENRLKIKELEKKKKRKADPSEYISKMADDANILEIDNLHTYFYTDAGVVKAVNGVSFNIPRNSTVGVVGESGCGKSVTSLSTMRLVQGPNGQIVDGQIRFKANNYVRENGKPIPVYETEVKNGKEQVVMVAKKNAKGEPVLDKDNKPVMIEKVKLDENGLPVYKREEIVYDIANMPISDMSHVRGSQIAMIFQEPMTSLNPVLTIGDQLDEVTLTHVIGANRELAKKKSLEMLDLVGIAMAERVYKSYPHELSGGMRQRVMIAMALCCNPRLIIADEPTTALDVTIQAQVLDLLREIKDKISGSIMLITHDLGVIAEMADIVVVMYAGKIVEMGTVYEIFDNPKHPYTIGLQKSKPSVSDNVERLYNIPGNVPNPINMPSHCYFRERCDRACEICKTGIPPIVEISPTHKVACFLYNKEGK